MSCQLFGAVLATLLSAVASFAIEEIYRPPLCLKPSWFPIPLHKASVNALNLGYAT